MRGCAAIGFFAVLLIHGLPRGVAREPKLYAVIVLDTDADKAGQGNIREDAEHDGNSVVDFLTAAAGQTRLEHNILKDGQASLAGLQGHLDTIHPTGEDALLCYMSCHGFTQKGDPDGHEIVLCGSGKLERIKRARVRELLKEKGAGLTVLMTDACSDFKDAPPPPRTRAKSFAPPRPVEVKPAFRSLFLTPKGTVDINACSEGGTAWADKVKGGVFTRSLHKTFTECQNEEIDWPTFYNRLRENSHAYFASWKKKALAEERKKRAAGNLRDDESQLLGELERQPPQSPQAYYLPGARLGLTAEEVDATGAEIGVKVVNLLVDSPVRRSGVRVGEVIIRANGKVIHNDDSWQRVVLTPLRAGRGEFRFTVRGRSGEREVKVTLTP